MIGRNKRNKKASFCRKRQEMHKRFAELERQYRQKYFEQVRGEWESAYPENKFPYNRYHRHIHYARPIVVSVMVVFWGFLFLFGNLPMVTRLIVAVFAVLSTTEGIIEFIFLLHLDNRILQPLVSLESAAKRIAEGDFKVRVDPLMVNRSMVSFVNTFNKMAASLLKSEQIKKKYEENRKELIANISHDLKTPVTVVLGYVDALRDLKPENREKAEKYLTVIKSNTIYLNRLIDDLFLFSKLDIHRLNLDMENIILNDYLRDLMEEFSLDLEEQKILFTYTSMLPEQTTARLDPKQFCRIVRNIIDNAKRYGPATGLKIEVVATILPENYFCLSIADNGYGLPEESLLHIFDRFYRADAERTKHVESTGLGLAIAKELTEAHGGTIRARNVVSGGLVFDICIPIPDAEQ